MKNKLLEIYEKLFRRYGDLEWWPAETPYEVMVGAILTQNTSWNNVDKALSQFKGDLTPKRIHQMPEEDLQTLIRPAGFYKQKAKYLKGITDWYGSYHWELNLVKEQGLKDLRKELLEVKGVGNETADAILLYALHLPSFVVDTYTMRLFHRYPIEAGRTYMEVKATVEREIPKDVDLYNQYHALIVQNGKEHCRKRALCKGCPLESTCSKIDVF